jgi:SnoaL-like protein
MSSNTVVIFTSFEAVAIATSRSTLQGTSDLGQLAADRYEIADALHRFAFGLDHGDADSLASAVTEDCLLDFRPAGKKLGLDFSKMTGRQAIVDALIPLLGPLDTSHTVSNLQIEISDESATLYAYVLAQHFMPREGPRPGSENALLMNRYDCELLRDGQKWRFKRMIIDNAWAQGNPEILNALATHRVLTAKSRQAKS